MSDLREKLPGWHGKPNADEVEALLRETVALAERAATPASGSCWDMSVALKWADKWFEDYKSGKPNTMGSPDLCKYIQAAINETQAAPASERELRGLVLQPVLTAKDVLEIGVLSSHKQMADVLNGVIRERLLARTKAEQLLVDAERMGYERELTERAVPGGDFESWWERSPCLDSKYLTAEAAWNAALAAAWMERQRRETGELSAEVLIEEWYAVHTSTGMNYLTSSPQDWFGAYAKRLAARSTPAKENSK